MTEWNPNAPRETRTTYVNGEEMKKRSGQYLTRKFHATGFSRKEAAERAGITQGYLTGLLAGRIILPSPEILENMARWWGFSIAEYMVAVGLLNNGDIEGYVAKQKLPPSDYPEELQCLVGRLMSLSPEKCKQVAGTLGAMLQGLGVA